MLSTDLDAACKDISLKVNFGKTQFLTTYVPSESLMIDGYGIVLVFKHKYIAD